MAAALHVEGLSVSYGRRAVLHALTLPPLEPGGITALIGPNAAGKTTLLRALAGLMPMRGTVRLGAADLTRLGLAGHAAHIAYMPQALPQRVALTVFEATLGALMASPGRPLPITAARARTLATLERLGLADLALRTLDELSGGQRQLASLAQSVVREPAVLLLDEPTSALDIHHQLQVMALVDALARERGMVVVAVLHDIALACRWCRRVVMLAGGTVIADGTPAEAVTPETLACGYGVEARVERCSRGFLQILVDRAIEPDQPRSVAPPST
ncbi:MAG TPA: ABC transporter ATP-binding protein [Xanthobacteraceae bacterium]|nr:ABC transporter ATP-binding protein [Xanthobacteraceae bacterium]